MARILKAKGMRINVIIEHELATMLKQVCSDARTTVSGFVQDAIAMRLRKYETPTEFIRHGRRVEQRRDVPIFDLSKCHAAGWPKELPEKFWRGGAPADPIENLRTSLRNGAEANVFKLMFRAWEAAGLGEYTEAHFAETLRVLAA